MLDNGHKEVLFSFTGGWQPQARLTTTCSRHPSPRVSQSRVFANVEDTDLTVLRGVLEVEGLIGADGGQQVILGEG